MSPHPAAFGRGSETQCADIEPRPKGSGMQDAKTGSSQFPARTEIPARLQEFGASSRPVRPHPPRRSLLSERARCHQPSTGYLRHQSVWQRRPQRSPAEGLSSALKASGCTPAILWPFHVAESKIGRVIARGAISPAAIAIIPVAATTIALPTQTLPGEIASVVQVRVTVASPSPALMLDVIDNCGAVFRVRGHGVVIWVAQ